MRILLRYFLVFTFTILFILVATAVNEHPSLHSSLLSERSVKPYLIAEKDIESDSPRIVALAATLKQKNDIETIMKTFEYVQTISVMKLMLQ